MYQSTFLTKLLIILLYGCCCSFSAVPSQQLPPQKTRSIKKKRQLRQKKRQQKRLYRAHKTTIKRSKRPSKNHALLNRTGFIVILSAGGFLVIGFLSLLGFFGLYGISTLTLVFFLGITIAIAITGAILCILGLLGSKNATKPRIGFGIAGLLIVGIPLIILIIGGLYSLL